MARKEYAELGFTDDFLFCKILSTNRELCKELLELILGVKIQRLEYPESQKTIETTYDGRGVRLDVYVEDDTGNVYDIEMQMTLKKDLPKRTRYYQGMIDLNLIERAAKFSALKKSFVIFICMSDPFGRGLPVYTFTNRCWEDPSLELGDDAVKVIINADGSRDGLSKEMANFLDFLKEETSRDAFTEKLQNAVNEAVAHKRWEMEYMTLWMKMQDERDEGFAEGQIKGDELRLINMTCRKLAKGKHPAHIAEELDEDLQKVQSICDAAEPFAPDYNAEKIYDAMQKETIMA